MLTNPLPGSPAAVFQSVLATDPDHAPAPGVQQMAFFSTSNFPGLPSLVNEVVWVPAYALINANMEIDGLLVSQGWATDGVTTVTSNYTAQSTDALILADATGGAITVTLPDATQTGFSPGQRYTIIKKDSSANNVTVAASAGQLIGGGSTVTLTAANGYVSVAFDGITGTNWWIWATSGGGFSPTGAAGGALTGTYPNPGLATVPVSSGGTGATTQQAAMNAIAGGVLSGKYLRGDGTNVVLHVINAADLPTGTTSTQGALQLDGTATDIQALGTQAAGAVGKPADAGHVHPTTGFKTLVNSVALAGYTLVNSTGDVITWTAPNDGALHRFIVTGTIDVTTAETGGQIIVSWTAPDGTASGSGIQLFAGGRAVGVGQNIVVGQCQANTTVAVHQQTAMSAGAAKLWADIWAM